MPTTLDALVDRVRSLCVAPPFGWVESARLDRFDYDPSQMFGGVSVFRLDTTSQPPRGGTSYSEERTDLVTVTVGRAIDGDYDAARRGLLRAAHSLTAAIVRDGHEDSGSYTVPDTAQVGRIEPDSSAAYLSLRVTVPVNYEAQL